jgi:hypothetical protein
MCPRRTPTVRTPDRGSGSSSGQRTPPQRPVPQPPGHPLRGLRCPRWAVVPAGLRWSTGPGRRRRTTTIRTADTMIRTGGQRTRLADTGSRMWHCRTSMATAVVKRTLRQPFRPDGCQPVASVRGWSQRPVRKIRSRPEAQLPRTPPGVRRALCAVVARRRTAASPRSASITARKRRCRAARLVREHGQREVLLPWQATHVPVP